jgi:hypothetical protein
LAAHKRTDELALDSRRHGFQVESGILQKFSGFIEGIDSGRFDFDRFEAGSLQFVPILLIGECAGKCTKMSRGLARLAARRRSTNCLQLRHSPCS